MFDIFNTRKLKKAIETGESLAKTAENAQNEWSLAQEHSKELIKIAEQLEVDIARKNEEISKLTDEYNALVKANDETNVNYNELINNYNEVATNYNTLVENSQSVAISKTRTFSDLEDYPEESHVDIVEQWSNEAKLELLDSLTEYVEVETVLTDDYSSTQMFSISILKPTK